MSINAPELRRVLAHIETHQDLWEQSWWRSFINEDEQGRCNTAYCFAGWKCELDGVTWAHGPEDGYEGDSDLIILPTGMTNASTYAIDALGLTWEQAMQLFDSENTLDDLRRIVAKLCEQAEQVTP